MGKQCSCILQCVRPVLIEVSLHLAVRPGVHWKCTWSTSEVHLKANLQSNLAPTWPNLDQNLVQLGPSLAQLGPKFGPTWPQLGPTWPKIWFNLAPTWPNLAQNLVQLGPNLAQLGPNLARFGPNLSPTWSQLGPTWPNLAPTYPQLGPKQSQETPMAIPAAPWWRAQSSHKSKTQHVCTIQDEPFKRSINERFIFNAAIRIEQAC